ncbi:MAG: aminotransferase class V-fold PLP-dependent enzyme [Candidatus Omnitrophota bacterium]|nr:aminotransferase class V-fold PLP-dependent enzyme [Candidatus Omnitrophota bacterium]
MTPYYLDYNATTPVAPEVWAAMEPCLKHDFGNPSSIHEKGRATARALRDARRNVAELIGASDEREIVFTSGGTEANNTAIRAALRASAPNKRIVTTAVEHSSVLKLCRQLAAEGYEVIEIGVDGHGRLNFEQLHNSLSQDTAVVTVMLANNETGALFPVDKVAQLAKERGVLFHVDAVQAVGKCDLNVQNLAADYVSLSAHKFYGPKGAGALYVKKTAPYQSLIFGGSQERGKRAGTENVSGIVGLGAASRLAKNNMQETHSSLKTLRDAFETEVISSIPDSIVNAVECERLPNTSNIKFEGVDAEALLMCLDQRGVYASSGSACMSGSLEPSHVLTAMGLNSRQANSSVRFSFGRPILESDIREVVKILRDTVTELRELDMSEHTAHS